VAVVVERLESDADLAEVVRATGAAGRFAGGLDRWQEQRHQDADDGDHYQQFHQGKTV